MYAAVFLQHAAGITAGTEAWDFIYADDNN